MSPSPQFAPGVTPIPDVVAQPGGGEFLHFTELLALQMDLMPERLRQAASFVLSHPVDVALYSMRIQASRAGVSHSTMARLAEWMDLDGYDALRGIYQQALKAGAIHNGIPPVPEAKAAVNEEDSLQLLATEVEQLNHGDNLRHHARAASVLSMADRIICVADEEAFSVATHFQKVLEAMGRAAMTYSPSQGMPAADLKFLRPSHAMLAICTPSAALRTTNVARYATRRGTHVVALTHCPRSSIVPISHATIILPRLRNTLPSLATTVAAVEIIASMMN